MLIHWSNWIITDLSSLDTDAVAPQKSVSFFEGLVKPLTIETTCKRHSNQLAEPILSECSTSGMAFPSFSDKQSEHSCPLDVVKFLVHLEFSAEFESLVCSLIVYCSIMQ
jgi:hypothetical protein